MLIKNTDRQLAVKLTVFASVVAWRKLPYCCDKYAGL